MRKGSRVIMWIVIIGVGAVFVLYLGFQGGYTAQDGVGEVVRVGDRAYTTRDVLRVMNLQEQQLRENLGDAYDPEVARDYVVDQSAGALLRTALLAEEGQRLGLAVSDDEMRAYLKSLPGFVDESGRLDRENIEPWAQRNFGSVRRFQEQMRDELLSAKTARLLRQAAAVSSAEARDSLRYNTEQVSLAVARLEAMPAEDVVIEEAAVQSLLADDPTRVNEAYEGRKGEFEQPERVHARHILIRIDTDSEEAERAEARATIDEIRGQLEGGAEFASLATELSQDPGSAARGGELTPFPRGAMVPPFEEAAFSLEPGVLSEVVETEHGLHLILVEERLPASSTPLAEAHMEVARSLLQADAAREATKARAEALAADAVSQGSLVDAAREAGLTIQRPDPFVRRPDGFIPGVGAIPEIATAAFALTDERPVDGIAYEAPGDTYIVIELLERTEPAAAEIEAQVDTERQRLLDQRQAELEGSWLTQRRDALLASGDLVYDLSLLRN
jgi:peptidyl-prolyl cis-trans isomerase D